MERSSPRPLRKVAAAALAVAALAGTALVGAPSAGAGQVTQVSACSWPDTAVRAVTFDLGGEAMPADAVPGDTITLDGTTIASTLPWWTIEEAAQFEILGNYPVVEGTNVIDVNVDLTIQATNVTPGQRTVTIPAQVTVDYTPDLPYTEEGQQPHLVSVDLDVPDTTWTRTGTGAVSFSQRAITVKARFAPFAGFGFISVFADCRTATFTPTYDPVYATPLVFASVGAVPEPRFSDVPYTHAFHADVEWLAESGITSGYEDGTFRPANPVTRQAFASFLYKAAGSPAFDVPTTASFRDVPTTHAFFKAVEWARAEGIVRGYADGTFGPTVEVSRQAAAQWLYKLFGEDAPAPAVASFGDVPTSHPFFVAVEWMAAEGISTGYGGGIFGPTRTTTRQAVAAWFHKADSGHAGA